MFKLLSLAALMLYAVTPSVAIGSTSSGDSAADAVYNELVGTGHYFRDTTCRDCLSLIRFTPSSQTLSSLEGIARASGADANSARFDDVRQMIAQLNIVSQDQYGRGRIPVADHETICTTITKAYWAQKTEGLIRYPDPSIIPIEGLTEESYLRGAGRYIDYLRDGGGMDEIECRLVDG